MATSAGNCGFVQIYWINLYWKIPFLCRVKARFSLDFSLQKRKLFLRIYFHFDSFTESLDLESCPANNYLFKVNKMETLKKGWNMFKVSNRNTRTTSLTWDWRHWRNCSGFGRLTSMVAMQIFKVFYIVEEVNAKKNTLNLHFVILGWNLVWLLLNVWTSDTTLESSLKISKIIIFGWFF